MIECVLYKELNKGTLKGIADIFVSNWKLNIFGVTVHEKDGAKWISFPSRPYVDKESGEKKFAPTMRFTERAHFNDFTKAVINAIENRNKVKDKESCV